MFVADTNHKGNVAELAIALEAARLGLSVLKPMTEHERYDLAVGLGGRLLRVQCKWATFDGAVVQVHVARCRTSRRGYVRATYRPDEIDALAAYCGDLDRCYLLPVEMVAGRHAVCLRVEPARNNQTASINLAAQYELGAVAQLEERDTGSVEVTGSSPVSSTPPTDLKERVGMDEFHARLAHYVRHAETGGNVVVTRWGRPVATLGPVDSVQPRLVPADE